MKPINECKTVEELLSDSTRWCRNVMARDKGCHPVSPKSSDAVSFCLVGALMKIYASTDDILIDVGSRVVSVIEERHPEITKLMESTFPDEWEYIKSSHVRNEPVITTFNDRATFEEIQDVVQLANV